MTSNLQKQATVAACVQKLILWGATKWDAAEHERSSVIGKGLPSCLALFADELNGFEMPDLLSGQPDRWERGPDDGGSGGQGSVSVRVSVRARKQGVLCRPASLAGKCKLLET